MLRALRNKFKRKKSLHLHKPIERIAGENNTITKKGRLFNTSINVIGNNNTIIFDEACTIYNITINIQGDNHYLEIGKECRIKSGILWLEHSNCSIIIGKKTTIEWAHIAATEPNKKIVIGEDCMFSDNISIRTSDSHSIIDLNTNHRINQAKDIKIGNHVWIGANVKILKGVEIYDHSIISTGAIVTKNISRNSLAAGIPAKVIKENITWDRNLIEKVKIPHIIS